MQARLHAVIKVQGLAARKQATIKHLPAVVCKHLGGQIACHKVLTICQIFSQNILCQSHNLNHCTDFDVAQHTQ